MPADMSASCDLPTIDACRHSDLAPSKMSSRVRHITRVADILVLGPRRSQSWATATGPCTRNRHEPHRVVSFLFQRRSHHQRHDNGSSTLAAGYPRCTHRSCATSMHDSKTAWLCVCPDQARIPGSNSDIDGQRYAVKSSNRRGTPDRTDGVPSLRVATTGLSNHPFEFPGFESCRHPE